MDLLIVGDSSDQLVSAIKRDFTALGKQVRILDPIAASQLFTLHIENGQVRITPDVPMILRPFAPDVIQPDFDQSFQHGEALSTLWAVAAACQSPVLNRPTPTSMWGQSAFSTVLTQQRARFTVDTTEQLTGKMPVLSASAPASHESWFIQDIGSSAVSVAPQKPDGNGPYRARYTYREGRYEMVTVLANQAWRATQAPLSSLDLESQSIQLLRNLDLDFGVVTWNITADHTAATLAKVDIFPIFNQVSLVWPDLRVSLYKELFQ